jgi:hypothetical protein
MIMIERILMTPLYSGLNYEIDPAYTSKTYDVTMFMSENSKNPKDIYLANSAATFFILYPLSFCFRVATSLITSAKR